MSSIQSSIEGNAEEDRGEIIQSLKSWYAEFKTLDTDRSALSFLKKPPSITNKTLSVPEVPPASILKGSSKGGAAQKKFFFTVDEERIAIRERINLFKRYGAYFIHNGKVKKVKKYATIPGFYLYLDKSFKVWVLIVHQKGKNETLHLSRIEEIDPILLDALSDALKNLQAEFAEDNISRVEKLSLRSDIRHAIIAHCTAYLSQSPVPLSRMHPVHVLQFSSSEKTRIFLETYFFEENIHDWVPNPDPAAAEDAYIIFNDPIISEEHQREIEIIKQKNLHLMQITVRDDLELDINSIIDDVSEMYILSGEDPLVTQFKKEVSNRTKKNMLEMSKAEKIILSYLIKIFIVANQDENNPLKQRFLENISLYYQKKRELTATKYDLKRTMTAIKEIYMDSYRTYEVKSLPRQKTVLSLHEIQSTMALRDKKEVKIAELKKILAVAKEILPASETTAFRKRIISKKLDLMDAAIDANPDVMLDGYNLYQKKIDLENITEEEKIKFLKELVATLKEYSNYVRCSKTVPASSHQSPKEIESQLRAIAEGNVPVTHIVPMPHKVSLEMHEAGESKKKKNPTKAASFWAGPQADMLEHPIIERTEDLVI